MLTIKVISKDGKECIEEVKSVMFNPATEQRSATMFVWYEDKEDLPYTLYEGTVYVMNENGSTIAKYDIYVNPTVCKDIDEI